MGTAALGCPPGSARRSERRFRFLKRRERLSAAPEIAPKNQQRLFSRC